MINIEGIQTGSSGSLADCTNHYITTTAIWAIEGHFRALLTYSLVVSEVVGLGVGHLGDQLLVVHGRGMDLDLERLHGFLGLSHSGNLEPG